MYSGKIAVPPGGGGIVEKKVYLELLFFINVTVPIYKYKFTNE
jgi:hypothetical protein